MATPFPEPRELVHVYTPEKHAVEALPNLEYHYRGVRDLDTKAYYLIQHDLMYDRARWVEYNFAASENPEHCAPIERDSDSYRFLRDMQVIFRNTRTDYTLRGFGPTFNLSIDHIMRDQLGLIADPVPKYHWPLRMSYFGEIEGVSFEICNPIWEDVPLQLKLPEFKTCHPEEVEKQIGAYRRIQALFHTATRLAGKPVLTRDQLADVFHVRL